MTRKRTEDATEDVVVDVIAQHDEPAGVDDHPGASYRVLKAITLGSGQTLMPGDTLAIAENDPEWPARRPGQLVKQGYLRPLENV